ncbi:hypothetical protein [Prochlorococcus marinus]|uniref:Uncharacterized protein n=1 Tax=Prochlorococcus marinus (strain MIT 9303) TaxID=59922 RepID=A2CDM2_PROM3|nr:hypothetical protein [Prochlorococcus marinus]ABM79582.1 Hypothetical protein P9303_28521 [Prochlorococcus marinus str. MIT 9303]
MTKVCETSFLLLGTLLTLTGTFVPIAFASTKASGGFGSPNTKATYSYVQIKGPQYAVAVTTKDSSLDQKMNLTSPSVLWIDCSGSVSWNGMTDFGDGQWSNVQLEKYADKLSNDFCGYLKFKGFLSP